MLDNISNTYVAFCSCCVFLRARSDSFRIKAIYFNVGCVVLRTRSRQFVRHLNLPVAICMPLQYLTAVSAAVAVTGAVFPSYCWYLRVAIVQV